MRKTAIIRLLVIFTALHSSLFTIHSSLFTATAQTLTVTTSSGSTQVSASDAGTMTYDSSAGTITIGGTAYSVSDISKISITEASSTSDETSQTVSVAYSGSSATVTVSSDIASYVTVTQSGAHVSIAQSDDLAAEITYTLSGTSTDGEFYMSGSYKATIELSGLTLTNTTPVYSGAAVHIQNGKRIKVKVVTGTTNTLVDAATGSQKGCLYIKGHAEFAQKGTLNVTGNVKHGIKAGEYISVKNATINVTSAVGDGISCNEYFLMESGSVSISGTGDDGIQCDIDGSSSTGETTDHEDEDSGNIYIQGGTLDIAVTAAATKGLKADGDINITDGTLTIASSGNAAWDSDDSEVKGSKCLSADGNMAISGGTLTLTSTGSGGKGIKVDGTLAISDDANVSVTTNGQIAYCQSSSSTSIKTTTSTSTTERLNDNLKTSPKGIKSTGAMTVTGGTVYVSASYHEGIETKSTLDISGGYIYAYSNDDAINSSSHMTITGGSVMANSSGNDGLDANGNLYIKGGNVFAVATKEPEVGIDANTEGGYKLYITGGNVVAIGGLESGSSLSGVTAKQTSSYSKGAWYALYNGSNVAFAFKVPSNSSMGSSMVVVTADTPALKSGVTASGTAFWSGNGYTSCSGGSDVSLSTYSSSSSGGGGGNQPGGGGGPGGGR